MQQSILLNVRIGEILLRGYVDKFVNSCRADNKDGTTMRRKVARSLH